MTEITWLSEHAVLVARMVELHKLHALCAFDGGFDGECEIAGIHIEVDDRGPDARRHGVGVLLRVWGQHLSMTRLDELHVALACLKELVDDTCMSVGVRFCSEEDDVASQCIYCRATRSRQENYLCDAHQESKECPTWVGITIPAQHDARKNHESPDLVRILQQREP